MYDRMCSLVEDEVRKISEKGINSGNLETAYKLMDILKDIKQIEYWDIVEANMEQGYSGGYDEDSSHKHYVRGHYSRNGYSSNGNYSNSRFMDEDMERDRYNNRL